MRLARQAATLGATLAVAATAQATDTSIAVTDTGIVEAHADNGDGDFQDDHYVAFVNRLNVNANAGDLSTQLRLDAFHFVDVCGESLYRFGPVDANGDGRADYRPGSDPSAPNPGVDTDGDGRLDTLDLDGDGVGDPMPRCVSIEHGPGQDYRSDVVLERLNVTARRGGLTLQAGDFYQQLGRGIVLAIRKVDEAGLDVALQGASVEYRGDHDRTVLFGGRVNPANLDSINRHYVEPIDDIVAGHVYELRAIEGVRISLFGAYLGRGDRAIRDQAARDWNYSQGLSIELPRAAEWLSIYTEGDLQTREVGDESFLGLAAYATANVAIRDFSVVGEGIVLDDFSQLGSGNSALSGAPFRHNQAPTLERIDQETLNSDTVIGGRLKLEQYFFASDTNAYVNGMLLVNNRGTPAELRQMHGYAGVKTYFQDGASRVELSGGYRDETNTNLAPVERAFGTFTPGFRQLKSMIHGELDYLQSLGGGFSLHLTSTNEARTLNDNPYQRGTLLAGVDRAGRGGLTFEFGYDNQNPDTRVRRLFYAAIAKWDAADWLTLTATGGTQRGGIKCINGVCREYPAFAGARVEAVARF
ncbi:MAG: hypothetical protein H6698_02845 [Myxococcales bacterium]|nr:hypothetical protein [Myxococcales bacterium]MCB9533252.1 hypothetical protein [Myxococcales bacterium]